MGFYWGPNYYNDYATYREATLHNGIYYLPEENGNYYDSMTAYNAFIADGGGGGGGGSSLFYPGQGDYGMASYRPSYTYVSQADYDSATAGGYLGYISQEMYDADTAGRGEGGGSYETTSSGIDNVYSSGSASSIGNQSTNNPYELQGGNDIFGQENTSDSYMMGTAMNDFVKGNGGDDTIYGGGGTDWLKGGQGNDIIYGNAGDDVLVGGQGTDILFGGSATMGNLLVGGDVTDNNMANITNPAFWNTGVTPDAEADTFVFSTGQGSGSFSNTNGIPDFTDGTDKIAFYDGSSYISNPFSGSLTTETISMGTYTFTGVKEGGNYLFIVNGDVTFTDDDVTTTVA